MSEQTTGSSEWRLAAEPTVEEAGPWRAIGMSYIGKNEHGEIPAFWDNAFLPRAGEIGKPAAGGVAFGVCRCLPGVTDGSFEYIAAYEAAADAPVPAGMIELTLPRARYVIFPVRSLGEIGQVWQSSAAWFEAHPEWDRYCGPDGCECAQYPGFELYPADFNGEGPLFLYCPVRPR